MLITVLLTILQVIVALQEWSSGIHQYIYHNNFDIPMSEAWHHQRSAAKNLLGKIKKETPKAWIDFSAQVHHLAGVVKNVGAKVGDAFKVVEFTK